MSTALYRRYRPESFADVIGQEHVTEPLMAALQKNRVNHAYLFSGPRGCGKTTSARILARCLNCAQGPTPVPCGECDSCVELARDGSGSLDVIEIDAASHGGVDDARDLRERATFAPVRDRYKIFIIDEAHMVTSAGFNALLKIVEEPPEHIKFIFATTEPDKVIGTIRSRTHHYPFRLVPPEPLLAYLEKLCTQENVSVAPGVLSLVIRAGGGSVRDTLSVLDQLMAGAGPEGLDYELAVSLLGYTPVSLLDDVVDAVAAADSATVFRAVDRVIQTGQDPRRFVEDLLERFRDLIIVNAMPDSAAAVLRGMPEDQINRMQSQAAQMGGSELSRAADITNTALTEMTGATSPRLHLELLCARILLPAADQTERGTAARVDRLERRLSYAGDPTEAMGRAAAAASPVNTVPAAAPTASQAASPAPAVDEAPSAPRGTDVAATPAPGSESRASANRSDDSSAVSSGSQSSGSSLDWGGTWSTPVESPAASASPTAASQAAPAQPESPRSGADHNSASPQGPGQQGQGQRAPGQHSPAQQAPGQQTPPATAPHQPAAQQGQFPAQAQAARQPASAAGGGGGQIEMIRRAWPEIMDALTSIRRATWLNVSKNSSPRAFDGKVLELAFTNPGAATNFNRPDHLENLRKAIHQVLALDCQINPIHDSSASAGESGPKADSRRAPASAPAAQAPAAATAPVAPAAPAPMAPSAPTAPPAGGTSAADSAVRGASASAPAFQNNPGQARTVLARSDQSAPAGAAWDNPATRPAAQGATARTDVTAPVPATPDSATPASTAGANDTARKASPAAGDTSGAAWPIAAAGTTTAGTPAAGDTSGAAWPIAAAGTPAAGTTAGAPANGAPPQAGPANGATVNAASAALRRRSGGAPGGSDPAGPGSGRSGGRPSRGTGTDGPPDAPWPDEPSDPFNDAPESNAWETAEAPTDVYSGGHLSDSEWATTNWAGTGSTTRPGAAPAQNAPAPSGPASVPGTPRGTPDARGTAARGTGAQGTAAHGPAGQGAGGLGAAGQRSAVPGSPASAAGARGSVAAPSAPAAPTAPAGNNPNQPLSRYQKLLNEAAQRGGGAPVRGSRPVESSYVEDVPSADDITLEDSGLVGRKAIERILGGRLIEERSLDGR
ncbi:DNA polymerase III subunit gamma and tau [Arthrobacter sp. YD2]|uniref:DNA polymerase III subunit gamma and tau n=1 Tax=Arthrobacter sp. YD2 TaxID=3058046 RepID=UPI0025B31D4D|nr:DNA polymerase III subunit gamma and tau [Arthrobacter sp. YD2]MDN3902882.1 DNA polymerase III subunit gamma and tau [Arthrobacter sp. YD2]